MNTAMTCTHNELQLVASAKSDPEAFAGLYELYFHRIYSYAFYRLQDPQLADDITAQVFEKALASLHRFNPRRGSFITWLFAIARNTIRKHWRSQKRHSWVSLDQAQEQPDPKASSVEETALRNDQLARLMPLLAKLDKRKRDILALKFGAGMTNRDIAEVTGLTESNVGVILFRTLHQLRDRLQEEV